MTGATSRLAAHLGLLAALCLGRAAAGGDASRHVVADLEVSLPHGWTSEEVPAEAAGAGALLDAMRRLTTLRGGAAATGQGALLRVSAVDAPAGRSLDEVAADAEVRRLLLDRFEGNGVAVPDVAVGTDELRASDDARKERVAVVVLRTAEGTARNLAGEPNAGSQGRLLLAVIGKRLVRVLLLAFPADGDREGLVGDLGLLEADLRFVAPPLEPAPAEPAPAPPAPPQGDEAQTVPYGDPAAGWSFTKPVGLRSVALDAAKNPTRTVHLEADAPEGWYQLTLDVMPANADLRAWIGTLWWAEFAAEHPVGEYATPRWPAKGSPWATLPEGEAKGKAILPARRPEKADVAALDRLGVVEHARSPRLGRVAAEEGWRGALWGSRERRGRELEARFAWRTKSRTFGLRVVLTRDLAVPGHARYELIREALATLEVAAP